MSRNVSATLKQAIFAQETDEAFIVLLTISHSDLSVPIRVSSDSTNTVSRGDTYIAYPFDLSLPADSDERPPRARVAIDNVDRVLVTAIRSITGAPTVLMEIVRASDLETVEVSFPDFQLKDVRYNALVVEGDLVIEAFEEEPYPADIFSPANFPGVF